MPRGRFLDLRPLHLRQPQPPTIPPPSPPRRFPQHRFIHPLPLHPRLPPQPLSSSSKVIPPQTRRPFALARPLRSAGAQPQVRLPPPAHVEPSGSVSADCVDSRPDTRPLLVQCQELQARLKKVRSYTDHLESVGIPRLRRGVQQIEDHLQKRSRLRESPVCSPRAADAVRHSTPPPEPLPAHHHGEPVSSETPYTRIVQWLSSLRKTAAIDLKDLAPCVDPSRFIGDDAGSPWDVADDLSITNAIVSYDTETTINIGLMHTEHPDYPDSTPPASIDWIARPAAPDEPTPDVSAGIWKLAAMFAGPSSSDTSVSSTPPEGSFLKGCRIANERAGALAQWIKDKITGSFNWTWSW
ncbi:hypothetical protein TI39_contig505g00021 [Zymoseptoria brevis]|uniref:Uncharacterized protein n=1 Tax=Zymoseptoria brevis TaxID=1047168 RepID=A0A0F4GJ82_9PEZI|nr:hypothetical protein TI39_contig505g00021 [Zymoseptoria brevis]